MGIHDKDHARFGDSHIYLSWLVKMDIELLKQYSKPGPRYTSYPAATAFTTDFGSPDYKSLLRHIDPSNPVSLYFHIPFCRNICYFCACSVIYTRNQERAEPYVNAMIREMDLVTQEIGRRPTVDQLHWGGGTPSFLSREQMERLFAAIHRCFDFHPEAEISIELDPRETTTEQISLLSDLGFNRASFGVQDFDPEVQKAINRIQPEEMTRRVYDHARASGFSSINFDLIYGLPLQTLATFSRTVDRVLALRPDRISIFNFAYVPWLKKHQLRIAKEDLPGPETRLQILAHAVRRLEEAGYLHIGMDHFALPEDELSDALRDGSLRRNFQGYSTHGGSDLIGFGVTSIGEFGGGYAQNTKNLQEYYRAIDSGMLATERGIKLTRDDVIRKDVIRQLISGMDLQFSRMDGMFDMDFKTYFSDELRDLGSFVENGLVEITAESLRVTDEGRFVIRNICMTFDSYLEKNSAVKFSNTV